VESSVHGVFVFFAALRAQRKTRHGRFVSVIRNGPRNGVTRAAVGTVGKGIQVTSVRRVEHIAQTVLTGGHVRADEHILPAAPFAGHNGEQLLVFTGGDIFFRARHNPRQRRQLVRQVGTECGNGLRRALCFDEYSLRGVGHRARDAVFAGDAEDKGPEADTLYLSGDDVFSADCCCSHV
jgi:hypothetical protein